MIFDPISFLLGMFFAAACIAGGMFLKEYIRLAKCE